MPNTVYAFTVKGKYPDGNQATMSGRIKCEDGYPMAAFEVAIKTCQDLSPGLIVDMTKPNQVTLRKLKATSVT